jgi:hypothetical protein
MKNTRNDFHSTKTGDQNQSSNRQELQIVLCDDNQEYKQKIQQSKREIKTIQSIIINHT